MKILFVGDVVGKPGRKVIRELLPRIVADWAIDFVIANCENAASGFGVTRDILEELYENHIDVLTSGNHIWDKKEVMDYIGEYEALLRPANYPQEVPGHGSIIMPHPSGDYIGIVNLLGRVFMQPLECPFRVAIKEIERLRKKTKIIIVDMHAEATSEKIALGWYLDGLVSAVIGTHTHVQTADERILPGGTAYLTDAGMTGSFDSVIGIKKDLILDRFLTQLPNKFEVAKGDVRLQGVVLNIEEATGKSLSVERLSIKLDP